MVTALVLGLLCSAIAAAFSLPLPVLVLSYLACFIVGWALGFWQRKHDES